MATIMNYEVLDLFVPNCIDESSKIRAMTLLRRVMFATLKIGSKMAREALKPKSDVLRSLV
jgi:hypothetical protein